MNTGQHLTQRLLNLTGLRSNRARGMVWGHIPDGEDYPSGYTPPKEIYFYTGGSSGL